MYKSEMLEGTFIELVIPGKKNIIIGNVYRHPSMDTSDYINDYLTPFLDHLQKEDKR